MNLGKSKFGAVDNALYTLSTAGLCDNCKVPKMINMGGDGVNEPAYEELYCEKKRIFIEPQPPEDQVKPGDVVFYGKYSGTELSIDGKDYLLISQTDVLYIV